MHKKGKKIKQYLHCRLNFGCPLSGVTSIISLNLPKIKLKNFGFWSVLKNFLHSKNM